MQPTKRNGKPRKQQPSAPTQSPRITNPAQLRAAQEMVNEMIELGLSTRYIATVTIGNGRGGKPKSGDISFIAHGQHMGAKPQCRLTEAGYRAIKNAHNIVMHISAKQTNLREIALNFNRAMNEAGMLSVDLVNETVKVAGKR